MLLMASHRRPPPFAPSDRSAEKRTVQFTFRMTSTELAILESAAAKRGITVLNLIRVLIADGLASRRNVKR